MSVIGRITAFISNRVRSCSSPRFRWSGRYDAPIRLQATRSALGAIAAVGSICSMVSRSTMGTSFVGRFASSSCARTAIRRACSFVSLCAVVGTAMRRPRMWSVGVQQLEDRSHRIERSDGSWPEQDLELGEAAIAERADAVGDRLG